MTQQTDTEILERKLEAYSDDQLQQFYDLCLDVSESKKNALLKEAFAKVEEMAIPIGLNGEDLAGHYLYFIKNGEINQTDKSLAAKYRHPDTGEIWTGRGKIPKWMTKLIEQGGSKEDYLIS